MVECLPRHAQDLRPRRNREPQGLQEVVAHDAARMDRVLRETHLYLTDYRSLYVADITHITTTDPRDDDATHMMIANANCWSVDLEGRVIGRWRPTPETPELLRDRIGWAPRGRDPLVIDLPVLFDCIEKQLRIFSQ